MGLRSAARVLISRLTQGYFPEVLGFKQSELQILFARLAVWEPQFVSLTATRLRRPRYVENHPMPVGEPIVYSSQRDRQLALLLHSGFLLVGIVHTLLGPILPILAARWRLDDAEAGSLFIAQFMGVMIGSALFT
jgi:hypothetical protein